MNLEHKSFAIGLVVGAVAMLVLGLALLLGFAWMTRRHDQTAKTKTNPAPFCPVAGDSVVTQALVQIRQKYNVPAIAMAVITSDGLKYSAVAGVRKRGTDIPATLTDLWHLGSDGKAMTSTVIARMVERGQLKWDLTLADAFADVASTMHRDFQNVTLLQLLSHRAGLPANLDLSDYLGDDAPALRSRAVRQELARKPRITPGSAYNYSNLGYIIAAAIVEKTAGKPWERVMAEELFAPLKMTTAGFGGTGTPGKVDQPWPHTENGEPCATNGSTMDNPPVMGPAGRIHCSIQDWAKFIQDQLRGARGESALLKTEAYQKLQTPPSGDDYALGWGVAKRDWAGGKALNHAGDNTMNFANVWLAPKRDFAILACVNQSGNTAFQATDEVMGAMIELLSKNVSPK
jgi:CubicO group peptidase (beta-lactamase class C family)